MKQEYFISKYIHTSVNEIDELTPKERDLLYKYAEQEQQATSKVIENAKQQYNR